MPKYVDHDQRRYEIGEAVLDVIAEYGLEGLTVRRAAATSGWSTGVLAHYVDAKDELIRLAVETMTARFTARVLAHAEAEPREALRHALRQLLPLDSTRRSEALTWFRLATRHDPPTADAIRQAHRQFRTVIATMIESTKPRSTKPAKQLATELVALADGLAVHHLVDPHGMPRTRIAATLDARLGEL